MVIGLKAVNEIVLPNHEESRPSRHQPNEGDSVLSGLETPRRKEEESVVGELGECLPRKRQRPAEAHESDDPEAPERENDEDDDEFSDDWRDKVGDAGGSKESSNSRSSRGMLGSMGRSKGAQRQGARARLRKAHHNLQRGG